MIESQTFVLYVFDDFQPLRRAELRQFSISSRNASAFVANENSYDRIRIAAPPQFINECMAKRVKDEALIGLDTDALYVVAEFLAVAASKRSEERRVGKEV